MPLQTFRQIFIGIRTSQLERLLKKLAGMAKEVGKYTKSRQRAQKAIKAQNLLLPGHIHQFISSEHVASLRKLPKGEVLVNSTSATDFRNYVFVAIAYLNGMRASNFISMKMGDLQKDITDETMPGARILRNDSYKTSLVYGESSFCSQKHFGKNKVHEASCRDRSQLLRATACIQERDRCG